MDSLRREKDPPVLEHGPCRHPLASLMASAMVLDDVVQVDCAAACGHRLYSDRGPLECPCHWPPGKAAQAAREFLRDPVHAGVSKERTFESSFVITVRQRRGKPKADAPQPRKSSSPLPTAHSGHRQTGAGQHSKPNQNSRSPAPRKPPRTRQAKKSTTGTSTIRPRPPKKRRQNAKELGICCPCSQPAIPGHTRCPTRAAKHRQHNDNATAKRRTTRAAAQQNKPSSSLPPSSDHD